MSLEQQEKINWIIKQHSDCNHMYDKYLPYSFHLRMVDQVYQDFKHLLPSNLYTIDVEVHRGSWEEDDITHGVIQLACFGHDLIEDTPTNFNAVKSKLDRSGHMESPVAELVYALTNEKGRNRKERANDKYYQGISDTPGAVFVKLCDRIANVQYSKMTKSKMFEQYKEENAHFVTSLGFDGSSSFREFPMIQYLNKLFSE